MSALARQIIIRRQKHQNHVAVNAPFVEKISDYNFLLIMLADVRGQNNQDQQLKLFSKTIIAHWLNLKQEKR
ncbi:MAG: hypothetical protein AAB969_03165 [Patescibacteria group bacterium]